jgi:hypothetical protein
MSTLTAIQTSVAPEAAARIAELGMQTEVDRMLDYARRHIPGLVRMEVILNERYDEDSPSGVAIDVYSQRQFDPADQTDSVLSRWMINSFPPEVLEHLHMWYYLEADSTAIPISPALAKNGCRHSGQGTVPHARNIDAACGERQR